MTVRIRWIALLGAALALALGIGVGFGSAAGGLIAGGALAAMAALLVMYQRSLADGLRDEVNELAERLGSVENGTVSNANEIQRLIGDLRSAEGRIKRNANDIERLLERTRTVEGRTTSNANDIERLLERTRTVEGRTTSNANDIQRLLERVHAIEYALAHPPRRWRKPLVGVEGTPELAYAEQLGLLHAEKPDEVSRSSQG